MTTDKHTPRRIVSLTASSGRYNVGNDGITRIAKAGFADEHGWKCFRVFAGEALRYEVNAASVQEVAYSSTDA